MTFEIYSIMKRKDSFGFRFKIENDFLFGEVLFLL
tara:strand:- start:642 stop:746 length:105 start_codon:yes stop_codon:yes gene_type:complete